MAQDRTLTARQTAALVLKLCRALAAVHAAGILHRDVKPSNVMIDQHDEPLLMDFGLARQTEREALQPVVAPPADTPATTGSFVTSQGAIIGTLPYMSREQVAGRPADVRCDIYSLGVLFYQLLTGRLPFTGSFAEILAGIQHTDPPPPSAVVPHVEPAIEAVCLKAMAGESADRYQSAEEMAEALAQCLQELWPRPLSWRRLAVAAGAFAVLAALSAILYVATNNGTIQIELSDPSANVEIKVDGETVEVAGLKEPLTLRAGEHGLQVNSGEFETVSKSFTVSRGTNPLLRVTLEKLPEPPAIPIARWINTEPGASGLCLSQDARPCTCPIGKTTTSRECRRSTPRRGSSCRPFPSATGTRMPASSCRAKTGICIRPTITCAISAAST